MAENILTNFQYSRQQQRYTALSGVTPTLPVLTGATMTAYTEADNMVLGNFTDTDLLDGEFFLNTSDNRVFIRSNDQILEFIMAGGGLDNIYTTGSTLVGTTLYFDRTDSLSAYTADLSSLSQWSGSTGSLSLVPINQEGNVAYGLASLAGGAYAISSGITSFAYGANLTASGDYSVAFGAMNEASGLNSFAMGSTVFVSGDYAAGFGSSNNISGNNSFAA